GIHCRGSSGIGCLSSRDRRGSRPRSCFLSNIDDCDCLVLRFICRHRWSLRSLMLEFVGITAFLLLSLIGFTSSLWWVVGALAVHGVFDWFHARLIDDPGVPSWWPMFCLTFDLVAAAYLAWLLGFSSVFLRS